MSGKVEYPYNGVLTDNSTVKSCHMLPHTWTSKTQNKSETKHYTLYSLFSMKYLEKATITRTSSGPMMTGGYILFKVVFLSFETG